MSWHEDLEKFPNWVNSIPNENSSLKKENEQKIFASIYEKKILYYWEKIAGRGLKS